MKKQYFNMYENPKKKFNSCKFRLIGTCIYENMNKMSLHFLLIDLILYI